MVFELILKMNLRNMLDSPTGVDLIVSLSKKFAGSF